MLNPFKFSLCILILLLGVVSTNAQKSSSASTSKAKKECATPISDAQRGDQKSCCTKNVKETTSGCTPSNCRGAKTKFGEAKVITKLRQNLINLKAKMENYNAFEFSNKAITVHGIVGETDNESLDIISNHLTVIELEIYSLIKQEIPKVEPAKNKAVQVKQLGDRISTISEFL